MADPAVDLSSPTASQSKRQSAGIPCSQCKEMTKAGKSTLRCVRCECSIHVGCLLKLYTDANKEALRNKKEWLADFICYSGLSYRCKACVKTDITEPKASDSTAKAHDALHYKACTEKCDAASQMSMATETASAAIMESIMEVGRQIDSLHKNMDAKLESIIKSQSALDVLTTLKPVTNDIASASANAASPVSLTYAQVIAKDLDFKRAVKSAVTESLDSQRKTERDDSIVVMFGLHDNGCDWEDINDIFRLISCRAKPLNLHRFGRAGYNGARPLKIELSSPADSREVLACANMLRRHDNTAFLRLSPWLSDANMAKVKALRNQCKVLNDGALANGRKTRPFVVISGVLMERKSNGKLVPYKQPSDKTEASKPAHRLADSSSIGDSTRPSSSSGSNSTTVSHTGDSSLPKNSQGGSQAAPHQ
jgi:hypothetical protein